MPDLRREVAVTDEHLFFNNNASPDASAKRNRHRAGICPGGARFRFRDGGAIGVVFHIDGYLREKCGQLLADAHVMKPEIGRIDNSRARTVNEAGRAKADAVDIGERDGLAVAQRLTDAGDFTDNFGRAALRACGTGRARSNGPIFCDKPHLDGGAAEIHTEVEHTFTSCSRRLICRTAG